MGGVKFNLKDTANVNKESLIYLIFRYNGKKFKYSIGQRVKPKYWNATKNRAKQNKQFPQAPELNALLDKLEHLTQSTYRKYINDDKIPTYEDLKRELNQATYRQVIEDEKAKEGVPTLLEFFEALIEERSKNPKYAVATIKVYKTTFNHLSNYKKTKFKALDFDTIDLDFFNNYVAYLFRKHKFSTNHVNKLITTLKAVLNEATEREINTNLKFRSKKFRVPKEDAKNIYLSLEELDILYELDLSNNKRLERVRDLFLVGCYTGLRFSDFINIRPEHIRAIDNTKVIDIITQKTKQPVTIPINSKVGAIIERYEDGERVLPNTLSNQKMNKYLKELGALAQLNEEVINTRSVGGKRIEEKKYKYEMISTHTARRSFATNAYKSGVPAPSIMKITGHTTESSFMKYIKINNEENALLIAQNSFFQ